MKVKFRTQYKINKEGNLHFSFLSISFGSYTFLIAILGLIFTFNFKSE